jgi:hypothetical protein
MWILVFLTTFLPICKFIFVRGFIVKKQGHLTPRHKSGIVFADIFEGNQGESPANVTVETAVPMPGPCSFNSHTLLLARSPAPRLPPLWPVRHQPGRLSASLFRRRSAPVAAGRTTAANEPRRPINERSRTVSVSGSGDGIRGWLAIRRRLVRSSTTAASRPSAPCGGCHLGLVTPARRTNLQRGLRGGACASRPM